MLRQALFRATLRVPLYPRRCHPRELLRQILLKRLTLEGGDLASELHDPPWHPPLSFYAEYLPETSHVRGLESLRVFVVDSQCFWVVWMNCMVDLKLHVRPLFFQTLALFQPAKRWLWPGICEGIWHGTVYLTVDKQRNPRFCEYNLNYNYLILSGSRISPISPCILQIG